MWNIIISLRTRRNKYLGANKHNKIVDNIIDIQSNRHFIHKLLFNNSQSLRIIFKSKCLMFIMNQTLPAPKRQTQFLPPMQMMMMPIVLIKVLLDFMRFPVRNFFKLFQSFDVFLAGHGVTDICDGIICIKHC